MLSQLYVFKLTHLIFLLALFALFCTLSFVFKSCLYKRLAYFRLPKQFPLKRRKCFYSIIVFVYNYLILIPKK